MRPQTVEFIISSLALMFIISLFIFFSYGIYKLLMHAINLLLVKKTSIIDLEARTLKLEETVDQLNKNKIENDKITQNISDYDKNNIKYLISYLESYKSNNGLDKKSVQIKVLDDYINTLQHLDKMFLDKALLLDKLSDKDKQIRILLDLVNTNKNKDKKL